LRLALDVGSARFAREAGDMPDNNHPISIRALQGRPGAEYDEETFLHLLAIERARAERKNQRVWLLLATLEPVAGRSIPFPPGSAARLFHGLRGLLRDTDIMGWYRQAQVAAAVLCVDADTPGFETSEFIEERVGEGLRRRLPGKEARSLRVRVTQQGPRRIAKEQDRQS
jgi:hypothetical protein